MLMLVKKTPIRSVSHTQNFGHSWGCVPYQGGLKTCHRLIRRRLPRTFTPDAIRQAGQILNRHVNSMELLIGRIKEKLLLTMSMWKRKVCVWISLCSQSQIGSPLCHHRDDPEPHMQDSEREECLASHHQKLGGQLQRLVTMPTGGGPFYKKPVVCYFT